MKDATICPFGGAHSNPDLLPPLIWAYIGDAVYELYIRSQLAAALPQHKVHALHKQTVSFVCASAQARILRQLEPELTDKEREIARRGRNVKSSVPKNADVAEYRHSTGFEALIGYLYLSRQQQRLTGLLNMIDLGELTDEH